MNKKNGKKQFWNVFAAYYYYPNLLVIFYEKKKGNLKI